VPFVGNEMLLIIQAMDQNKAASVGNQLASQGLNADQLNKETATRFEGVQDASMAKIELTSRVIAEVGYRSLYQGVAWLVTRFQTTEREFTVLGKALKSNPKNWKFDHLMKSEIAGENEQLVENMTGIWNIQQVLKQQQSLLVDNDKEYNTLVKLGKGLEIKDISEHFNNPAEPDDLLRAQNEQLNAMVLQQQEQLQILNDNPLAEAAKIEAEGKLIEAQGKRELDVATMLQDAKEFKQEMRLEFDKLAEKARATDLKTATDLTKIEADSGIDVEGSNI
jgi:hypothetical protein